jgi:hypothetical protein
MRASLKVPLKTIQRNSAGKIDTITMTPPPNRRSPHAPRGVDEIIDNDDSSLTVSPPARHPPE